MSVNAVPQLRFQELEYSADEGSSSVVVCVELVGGPLITSATAFLSTYSQTALGK